MTPEEARERAALAVREWAPGYQPGRYLRLEERVAEAILAVVEEEREACVAIVETYGTENGHLDGLAEAIAAAILARGEGKQ